MAAPGAMAGARLIDVEKLQQVSASRQRRLLSRMGELGQPRSRRAWRRGCARRTTSLPYISPISPPYLPISQAFLRLQQAHWVLSHPGRRRDYDRLGW